MQRTLRYPGFWLAVGLVGIVFLCQTALTVPLEVIDTVLQHQGSAPLRLIREPFVLGVVNIIAVGVAIAVGLLVNRLGPRQAFPLGRIPRGAWMAMVLLALGSGVVLSEVDNAFRWLLPMPKWFAELMADLFVAEDRFGSLFFTVVLVAPVTEELLFRGIILRGLLGRFRPWTAIVLSATLFAFMHMNPWQLIPPFALGLMFGWFYLRTGSLWPCIAGHALNNFLFLIVTQAPFGLWEPLKKEDLVSVEFQPWWLDVAGVILLALGVWLFRKNSPLPAEPVENLPPPLAPPENLPPVIPV